MHLQTHTLHDNVNLINNGSNYAVATTSVTVDAAASFLVRDIIKFAKHAQNTELQSSATNTFNN